MPWPPLIRRATPWAISALLHGGLLGCLALEFHDITKQRIQFRSGQPIVVEWSTAVPEQKAEAAAVEVELPESPPTPLELESTSPESRGMPALERQRQAPRAASPAISIDSPRRPATRRSEDADDVPMPSAIAVRRQHSNPIKPPDQPQRESNSPHPTASVAAFEPTELGTQVDELPQALPENTPPVYPSDALSQRIQGKVLLRVRIRPDGRVEQIEIETSSGTSSLDQSAVSAVRNWQFLPARQFGVAVEYTVLIPIRFSLRGN